MCGDHGWEDTHKVSFTSFPASFFTLHPTVIPRNANKTGIKGISLPLDLDLSYCARLNHLSSKSAQALRACRWNTLQNAVVPEPGKRRNNLGQIFQEAAFKACVLLRVFVLKKLTLDIWKEVKYLWAFDGPFPPQVFATLTWKYTDSEILSSGLCVQGQKNPTAEHSKALCGKVLKFRAVCPRLQQG